MKRARKAPARRRSAAPAGPAKASRRLGAARTRKPAGVTVPEFYAFLYAMEVDAGERYAELASLMEVHNNREVAALFRKLGDAEKKHADKLAAELGLAAGGPPVVLDGLEGFELPETTPFEELHYLLSPRRALQLAQSNEERAARCFARLAAQSADPEVRRLARAMAKEERHHVALIKAWRASFPDPGPPPVDPDPPHMPE